MELTVTKTETGPTPKLLKRAWNDIHRDAAKFAGEYWHIHFRPLHFRNVATRRYGYQFRQGENLRGAKGFRRSYTGQKLRKFGHTRPLVFSGDSERLTEIRDVRATATGGQFGSAQARVVMPANTLNFRRYPQSPDMRKELTTVIPEEINEISQATQIFLEQRYRLIALTEVTTFRSGGPI
jgi:hypothetical protein